MSKWYGDSIIKLMTLDELNNADELTQREAINFIFKNPILRKLIKEHINSIEKADQTDNFGNYNPPIEKTVVIDTSICGVGGLLTLLNLQKEVIILDAVVRELKKLRDDSIYSQSKHATMILRNATNNVNKYVVTITENDGLTTDEKILKFCEKADFEVVLLTADMEMAALAKGKGISVCCFEHKAVKFPIIANELVQPLKNEIGKIVSLDDTEFIGGKLFIKLNGASQTRRVCVQTGSKEYKNGRFNLKVGHHIFMAKRKEDYITFFDYEVVSISKYLNCKIYYCAKLYDKESSNFLPDSKERYFMRNFFERK